MGKGMRVSGAEVQRQSGRDLSRLLKARKLLLVLDLDHTLINSCRCEFDLRTFASSECKGSEYKP